MCSSDLSKKWQERWTHLDSCRQTKMALPLVSPRSSTFMQTLSREEACKTIQLLTGHANLRRHQFLRKEVTDPTCRICDSREETPEHLLIKCPDLKPLRQSLWKKGNIRGFPCVEDVSKFAQSDLMKSMLTRVS